VFANDLTTVLRTNDRLGEKEREFVLERLNLDPSFAGSVKGMEDQLTGLDDFLRTKLQRAQDDSENRDLSALKRRQALNVIPFLQKARRTLGVPPLMLNRKELEEALKDGTLRPGERFRDVAGDFRPAPGGAQ